MRSFKLVFSRGIYKPYVCKSLHIPFTEYITHLDCDSDINLYEDKLMSLFVKCKSVEFDEEGKLIGIPFSEEVTKKELPENVMNNLINMKFSEDDMIIRFTIDKNGLVSDPIILLEL
jgi:hypothetical protein